MGLVFEEEEKKGKRRKREKKRKKKWGFESRFGLKNEYCFRILEKTTNTVYQNGVSTTTSFFCFDSLE